MKMSFLGYSAAVLCLVLFASGAVSGADVKKAVGDEVSFSPASTIPPGASIIWKHRSGVVTKAIEYDEDGINIPSSTFRDITTLDVKTGKITIKDLKLVHSGDYTIDINSKEQEQRFTLTVMKRVPKPKITTEKSTNPDVAYLKCEYDESDTMELSVIWKNSTGETVKILTGNKLKESITVHNTGSPENYYTCTLDNIASDETSDPVREEDLFKAESSSGPWWIIIPVLLVIGGIGAFFGLYKKNKGVHKFVDDHLPWKKGSAEQRGYNAAKKDDEEARSGNGGEEPNTGAQQS